MSTYLISAVLLLSLGVIGWGFTGSAASTPSFPTDSVAYESSLLNQSPIPEPKEEVKSVQVVVTAYSSREGETDSTPFITAAGTKVRTGVVAANWLPLGTQIRIPELFGEQVFTVEDRMHERHSNKVDVWFSSTSEALRFGRRITRVEIL